MGLQINFPRNLCGWTLYLRYLEHQKLHHCCGGPLPNANIDPVPSLMCTKVRSAFNKLESISLEILEEKVDICFLTELWQDESNALHSNRLERMFQMKGLETVSTPRRRRRGGGVAIVLNTSGNYIMKKLHVNVASGKNSLETVWARNFEDP